jgi:hypothetical protein
MNLAPGLHYAEAIDLIIDAFWRMRLRLADAKAEPEVDVSLPELRKIPGAWYLGVPCAHCDEMVLYAPDVSRGHGVLKFIDLEDVVEEPCVRGHVTSFRLDELRRFRWRPRWRRNALRAPRRKS